MCPKALKNIGLTRKDLHFKRSYRASCAFTDIQSPNFCNTKCWNSRLFFISNGRSQRECMRRVWHKFQNSHSYENKCKYGFNLQGARNFQENINFSFNNFDLNQNMFCRSFCRIPHKSAHLRTRVKKDNERQE